jgi:hypothetical protein
MEAPCRILTKVIIIVIVAGALYSLVPLYDERGLPSVFAFC